MRAGRRFRMVLDTENRFGLMPHAFHGLVVQVNPVNGDFLWQTFWIDGKTMVLRGNFHFARFQIFDRLVAAAMAKFQFESLSAKRLAQYLVPEANPKNRHAAVHESFDFPDDVIEGRGVAGTV